ncbi:MAG TPA: hypothetical protein VNI60_01150 [Pyrinomonadaceae bacterium]|nr:hypothetical protein [Pyrinomonadaceae bacterium]
MSQVFSVSAQTKPRKAAKKPAKKAVQTKPEVVGETPAQSPPKKNSRPEEQLENPSEPIKKNSQTEKTNLRSDAVKAYSSVYFYEFSQPNFLISKISIEHDENGKGKITFSKKSFDEVISDPIQLSPTALERIKAVWQALNFLDSTENYQYEKDYSHLGNMTFKMKKDKRERIAKFNWTANTDAKNLADEYRRIGQQFVWIFDIGVARENQPLEAPRLMDALDSLIKRNEISDAAQMILMLKELSNDERIPLIARNHATRMIKEIEKKADKK